MRNVSVRPTKVGVEPFLAACLIVFDPFADFAIVGHRNVELWALINRRKSFRGFSAYNLLFGSRRQKAAFDRGKSQIGTGEIANQNRAYVNGKPK